MLSLILIIFLVGYLCIALEHPLKVNKAGTALLTGTVLWVLYIFAADKFVPAVSGTGFEIFRSLNPSIAELPVFKQCVQYVLSHQMLESIGEIAQTLIFLIGAMTTVELIDSHGGFSFITDRITPRDKRRLLWIITTITFFMSAVLDNLTTSIVMIMLIRKLLGNYRERWVFGSIIIIAANSGGAWSPIGDVTTIMLWVKGNISTGETIPNLILPSIASAVVPTFFVSRWLKGSVTPPRQKVGDAEANPLLAVLSRSDRFTIFLMGVIGLLFVPVFKTVTHLPPFVGILLVVGVLWIYTEILYHRRKVDEAVAMRLSRVIQRIDGATLMFFLGILLAVEVLRYSGILGSFSEWLDATIGNVFAVNIIIGTLSAVVDNVPLVAGAMGMYPLATEVMVAASSNPEYLMNFMQDGIFWQFLAYCAGVGGSMLIIGSAAGVVVMGLERINFIWYLKNISFYAMLGYLAGAGIYILQTMAF